MKRLILLLLILPVCYGLGVSDDDLIAYWDFDQAGPFLDKSTSTTSYDLTYNGSLGLKSPLASYSTYSAYYYQSVSSNSSDIVTALNSTTDFTVMCWVNVTNYAQRKYIIDNGFIGGTGWAMYSDVTYLMCEAKKDGGGSIAAFTGSGYYGGNMVTCKYNSSGVAIYINDTEISYTADAGALGRNNKGRFYVGKHHLDYTYFTGVDECAIYNKSLSDNEITIYYLYGLGGSSRLDDCSLNEIPAFNLTVYDEKTGELLNVSSNLVVDYTNGSVSSSYQNSWANVTHFNWCESDYVNFTGIIYGSLESTDYIARGYYSGNVILENAFRAYLLRQESTNAYITIQTVDGAGDPIENAEFNIFRTIGTEDVQIFKKLTDFSGRITVYLDQLYTYNFVINASGYSTKDFDLQPTSTSYTLTLTGGQDNIYTNEYSGIRYRLSYNHVPGLPAVLNVSDSYQNISFEVEGSDIAEIGINLTNHDYTCLPASCSQTLSSQGLVSVLFNGSDIGTLNTAFYFQKTNGKKIYVNDGLLKLSQFFPTPSASLLNFIADLKASTSPNTRTMLVGVANLAIIGIFSTLGVVGFFMIIPVVTVTVLAGLPGIGLIHPFLSLIVAIFGIGLFLYYTMRS